MPSYKAGAFIEEAIASIRAHNATGIPMEIIIVDDCSPDETTRKALERLEEDQDPECPLTIVHTRKNFGGPAAARSIGISLARYDYIYTFDGDDKLNNHPDVLRHGDFFSRALSQLESDPGTGIVSSEMVKFFTKNPDRLLPEPVSPYSEKTMILFGLIPACAMFRRTDAINSGGYPQTTNSLDHWLFFLRLLNHQTEKGENRHVEKYREPYVLYRKHDHGQSLGSKVNDWSETYRLALECAPLVYDEYYPGRKAEDVFPALMDKAMSCQMDDLTMVENDPQMAGYAVGLIARSEDISPEEARKRIEDHLRRPHAMPG